MLKQQLLTVQHHVCLRSFLECITTERFFISPGRDRPWRGRESKREERERGREREREREEERERDELGRGNIVWRREEEAVMEREGEQ